MNHQRNKKKAARVVSSTQHLLVLALFQVFFSSAGCQNPTSKHLPTPTDKPNMNKPLQLSEDEWKKKLSPDQYYVLRQKGTERAFTGAFWDHHEQGVYSCAGCNADLFLSDTKFESGCGWPSFFEAIGEDCVKETLDTSFGMVRTEITCAACGGHLGHVFEDGPPPTGLRYCINSLSMNFRKL